MRTRGNKMFTVRFNIVWIRVVVVLEETLHASSPEPDVVVATLRRCYVNYTGFLFGGEWSSNSPVWCARHLCGQMPICLADDIHLVSEGNRRSLRSSSDNMCAVPRTHNSFGLWRQKLWRCRPTNLEQSYGLRTLDISYKHFNALLKTYMFRQGHGAL